jgi:hypothetical protein
MMRAMFSPVSSMLDIFDIDSIVAAVIYMLLGKNA